MEGFASLAGLLKMTNELSDFVQAPNQGLHPEVYEIENNAMDRSGALFARLEDLAPWDGKNLLDLGCGTGYWLPKYLSDSGTVIGVEPDANLLQAARARSAHIQVHQGSAEHLPCADESLDVIHARFAYFFPSPKNDCSAGVAEALRVLRPGGSFLVIDNDQQHGEFASLLQSSPWAAAQGESNYTNAWWEDHGATRHEVMSSWKFDSVQDLASVLHIEFPTQLANEWIARHPQATQLSYGYVIYQIRKEATDAQ